MYIYIPCCVLLALLWNTNENPRTDKLSMSRAIKEYLKHDTVEVHLVSPLQVRQSVTGGSGQGQTDTVGAGGKRPSRQNSCRSFGPLLQNNLCSSPPIISLLFHLFLNHAVSQDNIRRSVIGTMMSLMFRSKETMQWSRCCQVELGDAKIAAGLLACCHPSSSCHKQISMLLFFQCISLEFSWSME